MDYWEGPARWINTILLVVVAFIGFDTLFRLLNANEENMIVGLVATVAGLFLAPFEGMFPDQEFLLTAIIAVLGYSLLAGIALAVVRSIAASRRARARRRPGGSAEPGFTVPEGRGRPDQGMGAREGDTTRPLGPPPGEGRGSGPTGGEPRSTGRRDAGDGDATEPTAPRGADATQPTSPSGDRPDGSSDRTDPDRTQRLS